MRRACLPLLAALALSACVKPEPAGEAPPPAGAALPAPPAEPTPVPSEAEQALARNDPAVIHFDGFGPASFGADEEQVRMAWGHALQGEPDPTDGPEPCYYLTMDPEPDPAQGYGIAFMFEGPRFVRYDVDSPRHVAPGDLTVGMAAADVEARFPGRVESQPHKYDPTGRYLVVSPEDGGDNRLVFEIDGDGLVTEWRIGRQPAVLYVEGCS